MLRSAGLKTPRRSVTKLFNQAKVMFTLLIVCSVAGGTDAAGALARRNALLG